MKITEKRYAVFSVPMYSDDSEKIDTKKLRALFRKTEPVYKAHSLKAIHNEIACKGLPRTVRHSVVYDMWAKLLVPTYIITTNVYKDLVEYDFDTLWGDTIPQNKNEPFVYPQDYVID